MYGSTVRVAKTSSNRFTKQFVSVREIFSCYGGTAVLRSPDLLPSLVGVQSPNDCPEIVF